MNSQLSAEQIRNAFLSAANRLKANEDYINELNVFPVPDGDTGTNMSMTIMAAAKAVTEIDELTTDKVLQAMSSGALRGARGNSGVILSQLIRGFSKELRDGGVVDRIAMAAAFSKAVETAYKAVMKPKEGTILTVAKAMSDRIMALSVEEIGLFEMIEDVIRCGEETLNKTPEMLPVLKEAGVVDSGGAGLMLVMKGAVDCLLGIEENTSLDQLMGAAASRNESGSEGAKEKVSRGEISTADIRFGYCTEFMINGDHSFSDEEVDGLRAWLNEIGDSIVCFSDEEIIKVHVHTNHPGNAFEKGLTMGFLSRMKVDNMRLEHNEVLIQDASKKAQENIETDASAETASEKNESAPAKPFGFISVSAGDGLTEIFRGVGVDHVIEGGQTMNPSTEDILNACDQINAETIFILPNNKNIILAANQAADIIEDKQIIVIPTRTIPQGISAMISFSEELSGEENAEIMAEGAGLVASAEITYAVRNTTIDGHVIESGDIMAIGDSGLIAVDKDIASAVREAVENMVTDDSEIITLYYGQDVTDEEAGAIQAELTGLYPRLEVEVQYGGQPIYYYLLSVE